MPAAESEPIRIVSHDPEWPARFEQERSALAHAIGDFATGGIHHVGSTAVPGLAAKPIIDILVGVESLDSSRPAFDRLARLGYMYAPYLAEEMHWFCKPSPSRRTHHLHLAPVGGRRYRDELEFRDRLRADPDLAQRYADLKLDLARRFEHDRERYTEAKAAFIKEALTGASYDRIGVGYAQSRRSDPRIAARIVAALGDAHSVLNVGAGSGSYEPVDREVTAVEPSAEMISQRPIDAAPVVQASAEALPFEDDSFDVAMAIVSDHHWRDRPAGLREMARVARHRVVLLNADPALALEFWLTRDYLPGFADLIPDRYRHEGEWRAELESLLGEVEVQPVPVPHDCLDGFYQAYWRRPRAYCDERVRRGTSVFHRLPEGEVADAIERLRRDLDDGAWDERNARLLGLSELDVGLRLAIAKPSG